MVSKYGFIEKILDYDMFILSLPKKEIYKMLMKKILSLFVISLILPICMAQPPGDIHQGPPPRCSNTQVTQQMTKKLKLTKNQKIRVAALNKKYSALFFGPPDDGRRPPLQEGRPPQKSKGNPPTPKQLKNRPLPPESHDKKTDKKKPDGKEPPRVDMDKMMKMQKSYEKELKKILSVKQFSVYKKSRIGLAKPRPKKN